MEHQDIANALNPLSAKEAREAINTGKIYVGDPGSPRHIYAMSLVTAKEAALREAHDAEMLSIAHRSFQKRWHEKPLGILWLSIVASLLVGLLFYTYFQSAP